MGGIMRVRASLRSGSLPHCREGDRGLLGQLRRSGCGDLCRCPRGAGAGAGEVCGSAASAASRGGHDAPMVRGDQKRSPTIFSLRAHSAFAASGSRA
jgi:hypothetical protein